MAAIEMVGKRKNNNLWLGVVGACVLFFLTLPTLIVIPMSFSGASYLEFPPESWSFRWYESYFGSTAWMRLQERHCSLPSLLQLLQLL